MLVCLGQIQTASALARDNGHEVIAALIEKMNSINRLHGTLDSCREPPKY